ncbi:hypothetical protein [Fischerella sp. PCC 9605]|uniref:hypothetical protein n=1 Tax=Fischerella sp. PCC 9605 TaxID=1173024 RepID=UPI0018CC1EFD|nr:hypothetical protein [Fischerella sp. PCC 9605]
MVRSGRLERSVVGSFGYPGKAQRPPGQRKRPGGLSQPTLAKLHLPATGALQQCQSVAHADAKGTSRILA